jgi:hypothetical protein
MLTVAVAVVPPIGRNAEELSATFGADAFAAIDAIKRTSGPTMQYDISPYAGHG